ncbi:putative p-loop containing nucleoside triphosphate hydrolase protein [Rosellinia necatrix]|uniref:Putative p-loop containing nucleoside triphosphate hydrolase protein n=1 Tax=Rosellinia necatrix TaxID=77044 RepID=A0A1W2TJ95_ROSNE|nr:putative p-loop containing nucleoside triphosphate hydrolase protein [Rosellinia necatrix]
MAVIQAPSVSDEEFDVVDNLEPVSELSSPADQSHSLHHLPGDHYGPAFDGGRPLSGSAPRDTGASDNRSSLKDSYLLASHWMGEDDRNQSGSSEGETSTLKYTKSVVQRFWSGQDLLIAVMGMTGSGKTTFISKVTGRTDLNIGHSLTSCTRDIEVVETKIDGRVVRFVDTPGFSDTNLSDSEVLQLIADYLATAYRNDVKLSGIIYLHPISDTRMTHHATKNLQMFQKLTGENNLKNVILATSMWDKVPIEQGLAREEELKKRFWNVLLALGAKAIRHDGTPESARSIAQTLMANKPFFVRLQKEMGRDNKPLRDTEAGQQVMLELSKLKEEHKRELANMEEMLKSTAAENKLFVDALREQYQERLMELERALSDERRLNEEAVKSLTGRINDLENRWCVVM